MGKISLLFFSFIMFISTVHAQKDTARPIIQTRTLGSFNLTSKDKVQQVKVDIERAVFKKDDRFGWNETDVSVAITGSKGSVLYKKNYPGDQEGQLNISADTVSFKGIGGLLLVKYSILPSCGMCGDDVQLFGFNNLGYMVALTGKIRVLDKISGDSYFRIRWVASEGDLTSEIPDKDYRNCKECKPYLEFLQFTGNCGFNTVGYVPIKKEGWLDDAYSSKVESDKIVVLAEDSKYHTIQEISAREDGDVIKLYSKADELSPVNEMPLKKGMIVKFFEGLKNNDTLWIHLRIAGHEGYIRWDDVEKLGFPPCG